MIIFCSISTCNLPIKEYTKVLESEVAATLTNSLKATLYYDRGTAYSNAGNYPKALEDLTKSIEIAPKYSAAYNNRGNVYKHLKEYGKAIADHTQSLGLNPKDGYVYFNRGTTYLIHTGEIINGLQDIYRGFRLKPRYGLKIHMPLIIGAIISVVGFIWDYYFNKG